MSPKRILFTSTVAAFLACGCTTPTTKFALNQRVVEIDSAMSLPVSKKSIVRPATNDVAHCSDTKNPYNDSMRGICGSVHEVVSVSNPDKKLEGLGLNYTTLIAIVPPGRYKITVACGGWSYPAPYKIFHTTEIELDPGTEYLPYCAGNQGPKMIVRPITQEWSPEDVRATLAACVRDKCDYISTK